MKEKKLLHKARILVIVLLTAVALNALAAGYGFMADPSGAGVGISTDFLKPSAPFPDFLVPGIVLFSLIGIGSIVVMFLVLYRRCNYPFITMLQGTVITGWILVQLTMVSSFHPLHAIVGAIGLLVLLLGYLMGRIA